MAVPVPAAPRTSCCCWFLPGGGRRRRRSGISSSCPWWSRNTRISRTRREESGKGGDKPKQKKRNSRLNVKMGLFLKHLDGFLQKMLSSFPTLFVSSLSQCLSGLLTLMLVTVSSVSPTMAIWLVLTKYTQLASGQLS